MVTTLQNKNTKGPQRGLFAQGAYMAKKVLSLPGRTKIWRNSDLDLQTSLLRGLELTRNTRGVFKASLSDDYDACWMRDQLYANYAYYYLGDTKKFKNGLRIVFAMLENSNSKIQEAICHPPQQAHNHIHAKFHADTLSEITNDWGHHQIDAIGFFLYMVGFAHEKGIPVAESLEDLEIIQHLVSYLTSVRYWERPDNGMWEEWEELHSSSLGAAVAGLKKIKERKLAVVPDSLITHGENALRELLPNETPVRDRDLSQLSLIWPYRVVSNEMANTIINRITEKLVQEKGINRYWEDNYYRSENGISAEWTMGFFWLSIIFAEREEKELAEYWMNRGLSTQTRDGLLPELYQNGAPNKNTPLAWSHALALIAQKKLQKQHSVKK